MESSQLETHSFSKISYEKLIMNFGRPHMNPEVFQMQHKP